MFRITVDNEVVEKELVSRDALNGLDEQCGDVLSLRLFAAFLCSRLTCTQPPIAVSLNTRSPE